jgi:predicted Zn-dependent peptidase
MIDKMRPVYNKTVLENGIRVISETIPSVPSVSIGVWINVGSRDEKTKENGVSHFIEHLLFKGTKKRSAKQIALALESIGGTLNAFTGREQTCYYAKVLDEHSEEALDVLSDILLNSLFHPKDFQKEKGVIIEEIKDAEDSPADFIFDLFVYNLWGDNSFGRPIMGTVESVLGLERGEVLNYMYETYIPPKIVVATSGNLDHRKLTRIVESKLAFSPKANSPEAEDADTGQLSVVEGSSPQSGNKSIRSQNKKIVVKRGIAQTHICLGFPGFDFNHPQKYPALLLSSILGGGMSSRLFQIIREEKGLAYNIYSFIDFFKDSGICGVYLGTNQKQVERAIELVSKEFSKIKNNRLSLTDLQNAKYHLKGNLILNSESTSSRMNRLARQEIYSQEYLTLKKSIASIEKVKAKDVVEVANQLLDSNKLSVVILGPVPQNLVQKINWDLF